MRTKFAFLSALFLLLVGQVVFAQVTGTVQDGSEFPISDAEVTVRGSNVSTTTDENGLFSIDAKVGDVLVIVDPMGTSQDFPISKNNLGILKFGSLILDEVVVTSVFDPTEKIASGSTIIGSEKLENLNPSTSIDEMLQGKSSGLFSVSQNGGPGSVANITIRGAIGLVGGYKPPLYVVDGAYMVEDDVISINPNDVEEIKVLKEAAQTAVYGARGANGVVIIKTKTAKKGVAQMSYKSRYSFGENVPYSNVDLMNAVELLEYENNLSQLVNPATGQLLGLGVARTPEEIQRLAAFDHVWEDELFKNSALVSHHFSLQTSGEKSTNNLSIGYDSNNGIVKHYNGLERITASIGNRTELNDWLRYGFNISGAYSEMDDPRDRRNAQSPFVGVLQYRPYAPLYSTDDDGNILYDDDGYPIYNLDNLGTLEYQVLDEMEFTDREERNLRLFGSAFLEMDLFENVTARTSFGANYDRFILENFLQPRAALNPLIGTNGTKSDTSTDRIDYNWRNEITYSNTWGNHSFAATVASEYIRENFYRIFLTSTGYPNNFQSVQSLAETIDQDSDTFKWLVTRFGYLAYLSYNYNNKYFLDGYFRRDGSSLVGQDNQYGNFWGASVGWDIAKENFMLNSSWINNLVLRASYGEVGDDSAFDPYDNLNIMAITGGAYNGNTIGVPELGASPDATWEKVRKMNLGLEFSFFKHRLRGKFDYFEDYRTDFLFNNNLPDEAGGFVDLLNAGEFYNKGYEVEINYDVFSRNSPFQLALYANFTKLNYEVTELNGEEEYLIPLYAGGVTLSHSVGHSPYIWKMVRYAGVDPSNGDALYYDAQGNITNVFNAETDAVLLEGKSPLPDIYGGFGLTASYKGFDLTADFTYTAGNYIYNIAKGWLLDPTSQDNRDVSAANYWQNPGDTNVLPRPTADGYQSSDFFLEKGDYIRFRNLAIGYTFDSKLFEKLPITGVRVFLQGQNLALWTKYTGNPVVGDGSREDFAVGTAQYISGSIGAFSYPQVRTYTFGINVNF